MKVEKPQQLSNVIDAGAAYKKYERLLCARAWRFARKFDWEFEDLKAQASLIFVEAAQKFNPDRGTRFSTYLYWRLQTLEDYCCRTRMCRRMGRIPYEVAFEDDPARRSNASIEDKQATGEPSFASTPLIDRVISEDRTNDVDLRVSIETQLGRDARFIFTLLQAGEFEGDAPQPRNPGLSRVKQTLKTVFGWEGPRTRAAWRELKLFYNEVRYVA
jgi:hypothetical protein